MTGWTAWSWDVQTAAWVLWLLWGLAWETLALLTPIPLDTLTAHLRPLFQAHALAWFLALGIYLWIGFHFLVEGVFIAPTGTG